MKAAWARQPGTCILPALSSSPAQFPRSESSPALQVPHLQRLIPRCRDHALTGWRNRARSHPVGVAFQVGKHMPARQVPHRERPAERSGLHTGCSCWTTSLRRGNEVGACGVCHVQRSGWHFGTGSDSCRAAGRSRAQSAQPGAARCASRPRRQTRSPRRDWPGRRVTAGGDHRGPTGSTSDPRAPGALADPGLGSRESGRGRAPVHTDAIGRSRPYACQLPAVVDGQLHQIPLVCPRQSLRHRSDPLRWRRW